VRVTPSTAWIGMTMDFAKLVEVRRLARRDHVVRSRDGIDRHDPLDPFNSLVT